MTPTQLTAAPDRLGPLGTLLVAVAVYLAALLSMAAFVLFVDDHWAWTSLGVSVDSNRGSIIAAAAVDVLLVASFGLSHSLMARPEIKRIWTAWTGPSLAGTFYAFVSALGLGSIVLFWQPLGEPFFAVEHPALVLGLRTTALGGWLLTAYSSFQHDHLALFGLRAPMERFAGSHASAESSWSEPGPYRFVRHPMMTGIFIALWAAPTWTVGRLLLTVTMTAYIVIGVHYEERDLIARLGDPYRAYMQRRGRFFPRLR